MTLSWWELLSGGHPPASMVTEMSEMKCTAWVVKGRHRGEVNCSLQKLHHFHKMFFTLWVQVNGYCRPHSPIPTPVRTIRLMLPNKIVLRGLNLWNHELKTLIYLQKPKLYPNQVRFFSLYRFMYFAKVILFFLTSGKDLKPIEVVWA